MVTLDSCLCRSEELVWREIGDAVVILTADGHEIHTLNKIGSAIWELADGTRNLEEIVARICARFDVSLDIAQADVMEFAEQLVAKKILRITNADAGGGGDGN